MHGETVAFHNFANAP